jgi:hypothetical protein
LLKKCLELCNLLKYEFIFAPPCTPVEVALSDTIDNFLMNGILSSDTKEQNGNTYRESRKLAFDLDEEGDGYDNRVDYDGEEFTVNLDEENLDLLNFYRSVISPFLESYWLVSCCLLRLLKHQSEYKVFTEYVLESAKSRLRQGLLCYQESVAADSLKNALSLYEGLKIIERKSTAGITVCYLTREFDNDEAINQVILKIEQFKN